MNRSRFLRTAVCISLLLGLATVGLACPTCKDAVADGPQQAAVVRGYFWSILFMMSMPFLIFGGLAGYFYYQVRQARAAQAVSQIPGRSADARDYARSEV